MHATRIIKEPECYFKANDNNDIRIPATGNEGGMSFEYDIISHVRDETNVVGFY